MTAPVLPGEGPMTDEALREIEARVWAAIERDVDCVNDIDAEVERVRIARLVMRLHAGADLRCLLNEVHDLRWRNRSLSRRLDAARSECAALAAKVEAAEADRDRADRQIRFHLDVARAAERKASDEAQRALSFQARAETAERDSAYRLAGRNRAIEHNMTLSERVDEITAERDDLAAKVEQLRSERDTARRTAEHYRAMRCAVCGKRVAYVNVNGEVIGWGCADGDECKPEDGSGMPHAPAQEAQERPETHEGDTGKGTDVSEAPGTAQEDDTWFADVAEAARPVHYREAAQSLRNYAHRGLHPERFRAFRDAADLLDSTARDLDDETPGGPR